MIDLPNWSVFEGLAQIIDEDGELIADFGVSSIHSDETCHANARLVIETMREVTRLRAALLEAHALLAELRRGMEYEYGWGAYIKAIDKMLKEGP